MKKFLKNVTHCQERKYQQQKKDPEKAQILEVSGRQHEITMLDCGRESGQHILNTKEILPKMKTVQKIK